MDRLEEGGPLDALALQPSLVVVIDEDASELMYALAQAGLSYSQALGLGSPS